MLKLSYPLLGIWVSPEGMFWLAEGRAAWVGRPFRYKPGENDNGYTTLDQA